MTQVRPQTHVKRVVLSALSPVPSARTYHASCLVSKFMLVSAGEANNTDLNDLWAMDLERKFWYKLDCISIGHDQKFVSKRFHTISSLSKNRVVSFGGCHSEYVHLNDVNVFDLNEFVLSDGQDCRVSCKKLDMRAMGPIPSSRWGHAATVSNDMLFILGGRNNEDINDLYCFNL